MTQTVTGLFETYDAAARVVAALQAGGVAHADISIVAPQQSRSETAATEADALDRDEDRSEMDAAPVDDARLANASAGAGVGANVGALLGGGVGLLAGLGILAIPGLGPVVAAGWLAATALGAAAGAATGGIVGSLTGAGVEEDVAHIYAEGVRRGGSLVTARVEDAQVETARAILSRHGPVDAAALGDAYRAEGWSRFDSAAPALSAEEQARDRPRASRGSGDDRSV